MSLITPTIKAKPNKVNFSLAVGAMVAFLRNSTIGHSRLSHRGLILGCGALLGCSVAFFFVGCRVCFLMSYNVALILDFSASRVVGEVKTVLPTSL